MDDVAGSDAPNRHRGVVLAVCRRAIDAIVVANYLHRPRSRILTRWPDGVLLYETFARGNEVYGRPSNREFLLEPGELLAVADTRLTVVAFAQGFVDAGEHGAVVQQLAAVGRARPWPPRLAAERDSTAG
jgi:hypothetical protein